MGGIRLACLSSNEDNVGARAILTKKNDRNPDMDLLTQRRWDLKNERQQAIVTQTVQEAGGDLTRHETAALAHTLHRSKDVVREMVEKARETLAKRAVDYVDYHQQAVEQALANGDPKALEVAARASQWALEHISFDGKRVVDKATGAEGGGTKIMIGIQLGGQNPDQAPPIVVENSTPSEG